MTQIFLSYALDDDLLPPGKQASGFVTALHNQLLYEFRNQGDERPELWREIHAIDRGDQFASVIEDQIKNSDILLANTKIMTDPTAAMPVNRTIPIWH
ncbi:MAG: hypothetical protein WCJ15_03765 [Alphaproteobacteria bacterium]|jgi:hypothetical protein